VSENNRTENIEKIVNGIILQEKKNFQEIEESKYNCLNKNLKFKKKIISSQNYLTFNLLFKINSRNPKKYK